MIILDGSMEDLDGKWIMAKDTACPEKEASPATLGLTNMAGQQRYVTSDKILFILFSFSVHLLTGCYSAINVHN